MGQDMSGRLRHNLLRSREATVQDAEQRGDTAMDGATPPATHDATVVATQRGLQRRTDERKVRRAFTIYERQDDLLDSLARDLDTDKGDVLRQIIDAWLATQ